MEIDERYGIPKWHGLTKREMTKLQNHAKNAYKNGFIVPADDLELALRQIEFLQWWVEEYCRRWMAS